MSVSVKTFSKRSSNFRPLAEALKRRTLTKMTEFAVKVSLVDTAAYVDSFGFNNPQGFDSKDRPRTRPGPSVDVDSAKQRNIARLAAEVDGLNLDGPVVFGNGAPHAGIVESLHRPVFSMTRREFTRLARDALRETRQQ